MDTWQMNALHHLIRVKRQVHAMTRVFSTRDFTWAAPGQDFSKITCLTSYDSVGLFRYGLFLRAHINLITVRGRFHFVHHQICCTTDSFCSFRRSLSFLLFYFS